MRLNCSVRTLVSIDTGDDLSVSKPIGKPSRSREPGERGLSPRKSLMQPCSSTSARSNGTTSFSTVSYVLDRALVRHPRPGIRSKRDPFRPRSLLTSGATMPRQERQERKSAFDTVRIVRRRSQIASAWCSPYWPYRMTLSHSIGLTCCKSLMSMSSSATPDRSLSVISLACQSIMQARINVRQLQEFICSWSAQLPGLTVAYPPAGGVRHHGVG